MSYLQNFKYELSGPVDASPIVFLHGVMGSGANWRKITPAFQKEFRVLVYDQRGHGWSFKPESGYSPEDYALDLKLILDELGWQKVILVGHSMGGRNALHFAYKFPQRVSALVIEDIGPEGNPAAMQKTIDMVEMVPAPFASKALAKAYFETEFVAKLGGGSGAKILGQYFYTNIEARSDGSADWRFSKKAILSSLMKGHFQPRWEVVRDLKVPTLFVRGVRSVDFPHAEYLKVLEINPQIQGVEIPEAGHWVHFDQPEAFINAVRQFLRSSLGF
jgi:pimeloyl-ACP methyl ester carboxylesterase